MATLIKLPTSKPRHWLPKPKPEVNVAPKPVMLQPFYRTASQRKLKPLTPKPRNPKDAPLAEYPEAEASVHPTP